MEQFSIKASRSITYPAIIFSLLLFGFVFSTGFSPYGPIGGALYGVLAAAITIIGSLLIGVKITKFSLSTYALGALLIFGYSIFLFLTNDATGAILECMTGTLQPGPASCGEIFLFFSFAGLPIIILLLFFSISPLYLMRHYYQYLKQPQS